MILSRRLVRSLAVAVVFALAILSGLGQASTHEARFVGSESCKGCHAKAYSGWLQTRMANVIRDPEAHPDAVLGDFAHPDPVRTFSLDDVAFVYGSRYKATVFHKTRRRLFPAASANGT